MKRGMKRIVAVVALACLALGFSAIRAANYRYDLNCRIQWGSSFFLGMRSYEGVAGIGWGANSQHSATTGIVKCWAAPIPNYSRAIPTIKEVTNFGWDRQDTWGILWFPLLALVVLCVAWPLWVVGHDAWMRSRSGQPISAVTVLATMLLTLMIVLVGTSPAIVLIAMGLGSIASGVVVRTASRAVGLGILLTITAAAVATLQDAIIDNVPEAWGVGAALACGIIIVLSAIVALLSWAVRAAVADIIAKRKRRLAKSQLLEANAAGPSSPASM